MRSEQHWAPYRQTGLPVESDRHPLLSQLFDPASVAVVAVAAVVAAVATAADTVECAVAAVAAVFDVR